MHQPNNPKFCVYNYFLNCISNQDISPNYPQRLPIMQADPISVLKKKQKQWMKGFSSVPVILNQYETKLNDKSQYFRVFEIRTEPEVQTDSYEVYRTAMREMPESIKKFLDVEYFGRRDYTLWYLAKHELTKDEVEKLKVKPPTYNIQMEEGVNFKVNLKFVKQSRVTEKENTALITQFLNIRLKQVVQRDCKMKELCRNTFFPQWTPYFRNDRFQVEAKIGFKFNLQFLEIQLFCDINNRLREMNRRSFLDVLRDKREKLAYYIGKRVIKNYGDQRNFVIDSIELDMNPMSKFDKNGEMITYAEYFKRYYQREITDYNQPLIATSTRIPGKMQKTGKLLEEWKQTIYLVPELVSLAEIPDAAKRALKKEFSMSPNDCISTANDFITEVNKNQKEFQIIAQNRKGYAHLLPDPKIQLNQQQTVTPYDGAFRVEHQIYEPIELVDVLVVYSVGKDKIFDRKVIDEAIKMLNKSGERYKIRIKEHFCLQVSEHATPEDWINEVEKDTKENGKPKFALFIFMQHEKEFYPILKDHLTYRLDIDSQMFLREKVSAQQKGALKIAGNIMKQIAAKKNQTLWKIHPIKDFEDKLTMIIGISVQRMGNKFEAVISRSVNKDGSKFKTKAYQLDSRQIPELILEQEFYSAMEDYIKNEKKKFKPSTVIVYRMGLNNEKFVNEHIESEYSMLKKRVEYICQHKLKQGYFPELVYIQVLDRPSQKMWIEEEGHQRNILLPRVVNPQVGTVMRGQSDNEFYLVPYKAREGTVQPSYYKVHKNQGNIPMEYITQFTYSQTYMYYNWEGSVRLPEVLQFCKKVHQYVKSKEYKDKTFEALSFI